MMSSSSPQTKAEHHRQTNDDALCGCGEWHDIDFWEREAAAQERERCVHVLIARWGSGIEWAAILAEPSE